MLWILKEKNPWHGLIWPCLWLDQPVVFDRNYHQHDVFNGKNDNVLFLLFLQPGHNYVNVQITSQHRLSGQSYESGVSGVTGSSRQSYHSNSSSSLGSLDRLEESGYSSTVNVHELFQAGLSVSSRELEKHHKNALKIKSFNWKSMFKRFKKAKAPSII